MINKKLIFDIGLHQGLDASFYLRKGFDVVGLEASPELCKSAADLCAVFVDTQQLRIVQKALYYRGGETVNFYINPEKDDWGSLSEGAATQGVGTAFKIAVPTTTLSDLVAEFGTPYYIKCDIEGGDAIFADQLAKLAVLPTFVSLEATQAIDFARLPAAGYDRFQIVNQYLNPNCRAPQPALEGQYAEACFTHHTSGLFGKELPMDRWLDFPTAMRFFLNWYDIQQNYGSISVGWLDIHACRAADLFCDT